ncbi:MAG: tetratricopeptide repeat protein [Verrucomicrobia bacterium]|nr:tetratricopeptide repeat protein [Verrucomicrobiota bacterium]
MIPAILLVGAIIAGLQWRKRTPSQMGIPNPAVGTASQATPAIPTQSPSAPDARAASPDAQAAALKQEAISAAEAVAEAYPNDPLTYALLGSAFYNTGRADEAAKHLKQCLELSPNMVEAYDILARVAYEKGDPEETVRLCIEALKRGPATPDVANRMGRAQMDLGKTEEAVRTLQQAVRLPNATSEGWYLLGQAQMQSGDFEKAKEGFQRAIGLVPDHTQAYFGLFTACQRLGQTEEAGKFREQFQKLEAIDRKDLTDRSAQQDTLTGLPMVRETVARTLFGAAQIYRVHHETLKAAELFRRSAALDADNPVYRSALEAFYVESNNPAGGVKVFEQLAAEQPRNSLNYIFLGRLQSQLEHFDAAERSFQKVQVLAPQWTEGHRALAELYLRTNRKLDQARVLAGKVVEFEPSDSHYYLLAVACAQNNDHTGAVEAVKKALGLNPDEKQYQRLFQKLQQTPLP